MKGAIRRTVSTFKRVQKLVDEATRNCYVIDGALEFKKAIQDVEDLRHEAEEQFSPVDLELARKSKADYERGEYQLAEDALRELQGGGSKSD